MLGGIGGRRRRGQQRIRWQMASLTRWTWVWVNSGCWWWIGRPGVLRFMGSQRVGHDWAIDLIWSGSLISLHHPLSLLVENCMPASERGVHCLFGLFIFGWLKYLESFPHLVRDQIASNLLTLRRLQGRRVHGIKSEKCPRWQFYSTSQSLQMLEWSRSKSEFWS